jgi:hypothetical protein
MSTGASMVLMMDLPVKIETSSDCANSRNIIVHYLGFLLCKN